MIPEQQKTNYEGGRLARRNNMPISWLAGSEALLVYRNYREILSPQLKAYFDGWYDQDSDLSMEMS